MAKEIKYKGYFLRVTGIGIQYQRGKTSGIWNDTKTKDMAKAKKFVDAKIKEPTSLSRKEMEKKSEASRRDFTTHSSTRKTPGTATRGNVLFKSRR